MKTVDDSEKAAAHRSRGTALIKLRGQITGSRNCRFQQTAARNHPGVQMTCSQRAKDREGSFSKDLTSSPAALGCIKPLPLLSEVMLRMEKEEEEEEASQETV